LISFSIFSIFSNFSLVNIDCILIVSYKQFLWNPWLQGNI
jgi:hypothetical protein